MNAAKVFFTLFFAAIIVIVLFTSKATGGIISALGGSLSDISKGLLAPGGTPITTGG